MSSVYQFLVRSEVGHSLLHSERYIVYDEQVLAFGGFNYLWNEIIANVNRVMISLPLVPHRIFLYLLNVDFWRSQSWQHTL